MAAAEIVVEQLDIRQPRSFGYQIGDKFERSISLQLRKPYRLNMDSLPPKGRLTLWLAIQASQVDQEVLTASTRYDIRLTYQVVNIEPEVRNIALPHHDLLYSDGSETLKVLIPATRVSVSILRDPGREDLQADQKPWLLPQRYLRSALFGALFICSLAGLAYLHWGLPFLTKKRPFEGVYRSLRKSSHRRPWDDDGYREVLQNIHSAFNETAGKTVFTESLDQFFKDHDQFAPLRQSIDEYFTHSRQYFFADTTDEQEFLYSHSELVFFIQGCRDIERGLS